MTEHEQTHPALPPLNGAAIAKQQAALAVAGAVLAQQAARRGGAPCDESWPPI